MADDPKTSSLAAGGTTGKEPHAGAGSATSAGAATSHAAPGQTAPPPTHTSAGAPLDAVKDEKMPEATKKLSPVEEANARYTGTANPPAIVEPAVQETPQATSTPTRKH